MPDMDESIPIDPKYLALIENNKDRSDPGFWSCMGVYLVASIFVALLILLGNRI